MKKDIRDIKFYSNDLNEELTIKAYLILLLRTLWIEEESFSGKRPLGNSGWKGDIEVALVKNKIIKGKVDSDGYLEESDSEAADKLILELITSL